MAVENGDGTGKSLIGGGDRGGWGKAATALVEKIESAFRVLYEPRRTVKQAKADVEAERIRVLGSVETERQFRAATRFIAEEDRKQANIESITQTAIPLLEHDGDRVQDMEDDWIAYFFEKCRIVSDEQMQSLWAKLLAGEANEPGSYSRKTLDIVASMDEKDANLFTQLCGYTWTPPGDVIPIVFAASEEFYTSRGFTSDVLRKMDFLGLISFAELMDYIKKYTFRPEVELASIGYFGREVHWNFGDQQTLTVGKVLLTPSGQELAPISGSSAVEGFFEYAIEQWNRAGCDIKPV